MHTRVRRDWRGLKHHLDDYSTAELLNLMHTAEETQRRIASFISELATELQQRGEHEGLDSEPPSCIS